jgi:hypothetical protein
MVQCNITNLHLTAMRCIAGARNGVRLVGGSGPRGKLEVALANMGGKPDSYRPVCEAGLAGRSYF